jgi:Flp pilus assembly pilin Flp
MAAGVPARHDVTKTTIGRAARREGGDCVQTLLRRDAGQTTTEYSLVLGIITLAVMAALVLLSQTVRGLFESAVDVI